MGVPPQSLRMARPPTSFDAAGGTLLVEPDSLSFGHVRLGQATELPLGISNISPDTSVEVRVLQGGDLDAFTLVD